MTKIIKSKKTIFKIIIILILFFCSYYIYRNRLLIISQIQRKEIVSVTSGTVFSFENLTIAASNFWDKKADLFIIENKNQVNVSVREGDEIKLKNYFIKIIEIKDLPPISDKPDYIGSRDYITFTLELKSNPTPSLNNNPLSFTKIEEQ